MVVANEQARATLKVALDGFDDAHLQKLRVAAYDRWNWDTNSEADKDWFEIAEELLADRGVDMTANTLNFAGSNGNNLPVLTLESTGDIVLGTKGSIRVTDASVPGNTKHELFMVGNSNDLQLGWELKRALVSFLNQEMLSGSISGTNGQTLSQSLDYHIDLRAPTSVKNML
jgi:hypothetical protein